MGEVHYRNPERKFGAVNYDYQANDHDELSVERGSIVEVINATCEDGWIYAKVNEKEGLVPKNYVILVGSQPNEIDPQKVTKSDTLIGDGGFADVFMGFYEEKKVALKVPRRQTDPSQVAKIRETLEREALIMSRLNHPNIVGFYGLTLSPMYLVLELCQGGTLFNLCRKITQSNPMTCIFWAKQVASAMEHLHTQHDPIVHADLKAENATDSWKDMTNYHIQTRRCRKCELAGINMLTLKITDFGLSRNLLDKKSENMQGSYRWMSPEAIKDGEFSMKSDVWAFAVFLWEIFSCRIPFIKYQCQTLALAIGYHYETLQIPYDCPLELRTIFDSCWRRDPMERIDFSKILELLDDAEKKMDNNYKWIVEENQSDVVSKKTVPKYPVGDDKKAMTIDQIEEQMKSGKLSRPLIASHHTPKAPVPAARSKQKKKHINKESIGAPSDFCHNVSVRPSDLGSTSTQQSLSSSSDDRSSQGRLFIVKHNDEFISEESCAVKEQHAVSRVPILPKKPFTEKTKPPPRPKKKPFSKTTKIAAAGAKCQSGQGEIDTCNHLSCMNRCILIKRNLLGTFSKPYKSTPELAQAQTPVVHPSCSAMLNIKTNDGWKIGVPAGVQASKRLQRNVHHYVPLGPCYNGPNCPHHVESFPCQSSRIGEKDDEDMDEEEEEAEDIADYEELTAEEEEEDTQEETETRVRLSSFHATTNTSKVTYTWQNKSAGLPADFSRSFDASFSDASSSYQCLRPPGDDEEGEHQDDGDEEVFEQLIVHREDPMACVKPLGRANAFRTRILSPPLDASTSEETRSRDSDATIRAESLLGSGEFASFSKNPAGLLLTTPSAESEALSFSTASGRTSNTQTNEQTASSNTTPSHEEDTSLSSSFSMVMLNEFPSTADGKDEHRKSCNKDPHQQTPPDKNRERLVSFPSSMFGPSPVSSPSRKASGSPVDLASMEVDIEHHTLRGHRRNKSSSGSSGNNNKKKLSTPGSTTRSIWYVSLDEEGGLVEDISSQSECETTESAAVTPRKRVSSRVGMKQLLSKVGFGSLFERSPRLSSSSPGACLCCAHCHATIPPDFDFSACPKCGELLSSATGIVFSPIAEVIQEAKCHHPHHANDPTLSKAHACLSSMASPEIHLTPAPELPSINLVFVNSGPHATSSRLFVKSANIHPDRRRERNRFHSGTKATTTNPSRGVRASSNSRPISTISSNLTLDTIITCPQSSAQKSCDAPSNYSESNNSNLLAPPVSALHQRSQSSDANPQRLATIEELKASILADPIRLDGPVVNHSYVPMASEPNTRLPPPPSSSATNTQQQQQGKSSAVDASPRNGAVAEENAVFSSSSLIPTGKAPPLPKRPPPKTSPRGLIVSSAANGFAESSQSSALPSVSTTTDNDAHQQHHSTVAVNNALANFEVPTSKAPVLRRSEIFESLRREAERTLVSDGVSSRIPHPHNNQRFPPPDRKKLPDYHQQQLSPHQRRPNTLNLNTVIGGIGGGGTARRMGALPSQQHPQNFVACEKLHASSAMEVIDDRGGVQMTTATESPCLSVTSPLSKKVKQGTPLTHKPPPPPPYVDETETSNSIAKAGQHRLGGAPASIEETIREVEGCRVAGVGTIEAITVFPSSPNSIPTSFGIVMKADAMEEGDGQQPMAGEWPEQHAISSIMRRKSPLFLRTLISDYDVISAANPAAPPPLPNRPPLPDTPPPRPPKNNKNSVAKASACAGVHHRTLVPPIPKVLLPNGATASSKGGSSSNKSGESSRNKQQKR